MANFDIAWNLNQPVDVGGAFTAGLEHGKETRRAAVQQSALAAFAQDPTASEPVNALMAVNPPLGFKAHEFQRTERTRAAVARVFAQAAPTPSAATPTPNAFTGQTRTTPGRSPDVANTRSLADHVGGQAAPDQPGPAATPQPDVAGMPANLVPPETLVDPATLPARTDGITINKAALADLYKFDAETAFKVQDIVFKSDAAHLKAAQASGATMAQLAHHLGTLKNADGTEDLAARDAELKAMAPQLQQLGIDPSMTTGIDLSDRGLNRYYMMGRSLNTLLDDERSDKRLTIDEQNIADDNARADRNTSSVIEDRGARRGLIARGQNMTDSRGRYGIGVASSDRQRGQDLSHVDRVRGQDMTDKRIRETGGKKPGKAAPGTKFVKVAKDANGSVVGWNGKAWVPVK